MGFLYRSIKHNIEAYTNLKSSFILSSVFEAIKDELVDYF